LGADNGSIGNVAGGFRRMKTLQKFTSVHASVHNHFSQERHLVSREIYRQRRSAALAEWRLVMG
jgi:putative transposase